jgi:CYTH domain-containing protein
MTDVENPSAPPGKSRKYARHELERRFLLAGMPPGRVTHTAAIVDRYLDGTRLRVRKMIDDDARVYYKLTQKVPAPNGAPGLITTVYLTEEEHARLAAVPARVLEKTRFGVPPFGVDVFAAPRDGLFLAEVEFDCEPEMRRFAPPPWAIAEVTMDPRFAGGRLVTTGEAELSALLGGFGLTPRRSG